MQIWLNVVTKQLTLYIRATEVNWLSHRLVEYRDVFPTPR